MSLTVIYPPAERPGDAARLNRVLDYALQGQPAQTVHCAQDLDGLAGKRLLFALSLGETGVNLAYLQMLSRLRQAPNLLRGCIGGLIVDGATALYTKSTATELTLAASLSGCAFVGRPLVEGTGTLSNFTIQAQLGETDLQGAYHQAARELVNRLAAPPPPCKHPPELLVLHASSHQTSNTLDLWSQVEARLGDAFICTQMGLRNGTVSDCSGCPYTMCLHFGERDGCFYGGVLQEEVYPALRRADALVMLCPNYNDALSANLTAFINRLTALFRQTRFYDKPLFAIVVSGYSGSDIIARQLIAAMNMNKSFYLPARFAMLETAHHPGEARAAPGIAARLDDFAATIRQAMLPRS